MIIENINISIILDKYLGILLSTVHRCYKIELGTCHECRHNGDYAKANKLLSCRYAQSVNTV